jgi:hypothetical protein
LWLSHTSLTRFPPSSAVVITHQPNDAATDRISSLRVAHTQHFPPLENVAVIMTNQSSRPKGPQPVIDNLFTIPDDSQIVQPQPQHNSTLHNGNLLDQPPILFRSSTQFLNTDHTNPLRDRSISPANESRPKLLRAKSDFGPRFENTSRTDDTESKTSGETEWGIRHGFDTQLASEEWNNLLNSVRYRRMDITSSLILKSELFPLLYR